MSERREVFVSDLRDSFTLDAAVVVLKIPKNFFDRYIKKHILNSIVKIGCVSFSVRNSRAER